MISGLFITYDRFSLFSFLAGAVCVFLVWFLQLIIRLVIDIRHTRKQMAVLGAQSDDARDNAAYELVEACKKKLRYQKRINPDWLAPLIDEVPPLIIGIANCYYPDAENPLTAPGLSSFARAIQRTAADLSDFLENRRVGRLIDMSGSKAWKTWKKGKDIVEHQRTTKVNRWYKRVRPVMQVLAYGSPLMWGGLLASNIGVRVLQPAIIDLIAHRAIELYSGRIPGDSLEIKIPTEENIQQENIQQEDDGKE